MDGDAITAARTAAGSRLATRLLAREDADVLAVIGTGVQGEAHLQRPDARARVGRGPRRGPPAEDRARARRAPRGHAVRSRRGRPSRGADVVCIATPATEPVLRREWLAPGAHVNSVGYTTAGRELDPALVRDALVVVESRESALAPPPAGSTDLEEAQDATSSSASSSPARGPGRTSPEQLTLYKSVGVAAGGRRRGRPRLARRGGARARHRRRALKLSGSRERTRSSHQPPTTIISTDTNCARLNGPQMSSLRRMNSTRKRSMPGQHRPPADQLAGPHLVAPPPQPDRHRAHDEELVDRRRVHLDRGRHRALRIRHRPRQVRRDAVVAVARELAAEPPDRVADRQRRRAHVEQPVVEEAAMARVHHHRQRTAECAAVEHEPGAGEQRAEVALLDHVPELGPRDPAHAGAEHDLVDPVHRQAQLLQAPAPRARRRTPARAPASARRSAACRPRMWSSGSTGSPRVRARA